MKSKTASCDIVQSSATMTKAAIAKCPVLGAALCAMAILAAVPGMRQS